MEFYRLLKNASDIWSAPKPVSDKVGPRIGDPSIPTTRYDIGYWYTNVTIDQLDSLNFPKNGYDANATWTESEKFLGSDIEADYLGLGGLWAYTWKTNTLILGRCRRDHRQRCAADERL